MVGTSISIKYIKDIFESLVKYIIFKRKHHDIFDIFDIFNIFKVSTFIIIIIYLLF